MAFPHKLKSWISLSKSWISNSPLVFLSAVLSVATPSLEAGSSLTLSWGTFSCLCTPFPAHALPIMLPSSSCAGLCVCFVLPDISNLVTSSCGSFFLLPRAFPCMIVSPFRSPRLLTINLKCCKQARWDVFRMGSIIGLHLFSLWPCISQSAFCFTICR